ncbi:hypothetical protein SAZ11_35015 [Streptomyces sp. FXJ1.4098]|nr:hypothetical protein [Streptomyces sp. FXJ1.4098]
MPSETTNPPGAPEPQPAGQQQGGDGRPTLEELRQQSAALSEQIAQHLGRGPQ